MKSAKSLYIHIPFCRAKCSYCDFYSLPYKQDIASSYIEVLCKQIEKLTITFSTIYVGGGTPTILDPHLFKKLLKSLEKIIGKKCEFSIEANPDSLDKDKIKLLLDGGINRISIGVQSLCDDKLKKLGRVHNAYQAKNGVELVKKEGFDNISIDLIFGVWQESLQDWQNELKKIITLPVTHISTYALSYEKNTPFFERLNKGEITPLEEEIVVSMYECAMDFLPQKGFDHYEVSNFAKKGYLCKHNLNYWDNSHYLGLGAAAVSFLEGVREKSVADVKGYIDKLTKGLSFIDSREQLSKLRRAKETAALKIRTSKGINFRWFRQKTGFDLLKLASKELDQLLSEGLIQYRKRQGQKSAIFLTKKGFLFCDSVSSALL
jgi:oxygen-independent coproporphyrinogen-3 oxidase